MVTTHSLSLTCCFVVSDSLFGTLPYGIQILGPLVFSSKVDKDTKSVVSEVALLSKPLIQNKWQIMEYQEIDGYAGSWNGELQILNATSLLNEDFATSSGDPPAHVFKSVHSLRRKSWNYEQLSLCICLIGYFPCNCNHQFVQNISVHRVKGKLRNTFQF